MRLKKECPKARHHNWFGCDNMGYTCMDCGKQIAPKKFNPKKNETRN